MARSVPSTRAGRWRHLPAAAGYAVLTAWVLWPAVAQFRARSMANAVDAAMFSWLWGVMPDRLLSGENPYRTDLIFHPVGADLELTTTSPLLGLATFPVRSLLGVSAQTNILQLSAMFLAGMATYLLVERVTQHRGTAFVAGIAYALLPARFVHIEGSLNLTWTGVMPLALLLFLRFVDKPGWRRASAFGGLMGAVFLVDPQLLIIVLFGLGPLAFVHRRVVLEHVRQLAAAMGTAVVISAPLLVPMATAIAGGRSAEPPSTASTLRDSSSPLSWVAPPLERLWMGNHLPHLDRFTAAWEGVAYPGLVMLGLAIAGVAVSEQRQRRGWVAIALVAFVLSLGPYIFVRDRSLDVPLPFFLVRMVPGLDAMRVPARFGLLGALAIFVLAALCLRDLARRFQRAGALLIALAGLLTVLELYPRALPDRSDEVPAAYEVIAQDDSDLAVLEVPLKWSTTQAHYGYDGTAQDFRFLLYQLEHGHPIVSGAVSRYPEDDLAHLLEQPVYRQVLALMDQPEFHDAPRFGQDDLADLGIGFVVYHRDDPVPRALRYLRSLDMEIAADDGTVIVWRVGQSR